VRQTNVTSIQPFLKKVRRSIDAHRISSLGGYSQKITESLEADLYGTADAVLLLYTIGELPPVGSSEHEGLVKILQGFQQPEDGLYRANELQAMIKRLVKILNSTHLSKT
jgi:hypothetical protein